MKVNIFPSYDELYQEYINNTVENLKEYREIDINAKILHYLKEPTFYYYCLLYKNTTINPFDTNILLTIEFINGEIPYVQILTNFIEPSLNDNRNYYKCLSNEYKYIFSLDNFKDLEKILESIIQGIQNFLNIVKESISINSFIFFGEYKYNHIYQINDFLQSKNYLNFYRINELITNDVKEEKYIIFTKLYFLLFKPLKEDKALMRLIFHQKLKDLDISLEYNETNNSLILKFLSKELIKNIEFTIIDRKRTIKKINNKVNLNGKIKENKINQITPNNEINKKISNNEIKKNELNKTISNNEIKTNKENQTIQNNGIKRNEINKIIPNNAIKEEEINKIIPKNAIKKEEINKINVQNKIQNNLISNDINIILNNQINENEEKKEKFDYSKIINEFISYLNHINFKKYNIVINNYKLIFNIFFYKKKNGKLKKSLFKEYNNLIEFYETIISFYKSNSNNNSVNNNKRIKNLISDIIFICSELVDSSNKNKAENKYLLKMGKYLKSYK